MKRIQQNKTPAIKELFQAETTAKDSIDKYKGDVKAEKEKYDTLLRQRMEAVQQYEQEEKEHQDQQKELEEMKAEHAQDKAEADQLKTETDANEEELKKLRESRDKENKVWRDQK